jgi:hypothetical protein
MRQDPGLLYNFSLAPVDIIAQPIAVTNYESQRSDKPKQATNIALVQPEIQGIARNFAPARFIRHLRQPPWRQASRIDEAAPPAFGRIALAAKQPGAMAIPG